MITTELVPLPDQAEPSMLGTVRRLLVEVDPEFVPGLSSRLDTCSTAPTSDSSISAYFRAMLSESWILARWNGSIVGIASFVSEYDRPPIRAWSPTVHVTTLAVDAAHRRRGLAWAMYAELKRAASASGLRYLTTRTWSTNSSHLELLERLGFEEVVRVGDDRASGIDTMYLALPVVSIAKGRR